jgi:hypothetical protein
MRIAGLHNNRQCGVNWRIADFVPAARSVRFAGGGVCARWRLFVVTFGTSLWHTVYAHMKTKQVKRTHILLPADLAREIDAIAGRRGRSAFLVETAREAVRRRKLLTFLESDELAWSDDHTELARGSGVWVRNVRRESEQQRPRKRARGKG